MKNSLHWRFRQALAVALMCCPLLLAAKPRPPLPPWPEVSLLRWSFDEPYSLARAVEPGKTPALDNSVWAESWSGYALNRQGKGLKPVVLPMSSGQFLNLAPAQGAIRFWFKPEWSSRGLLGGAGPGHHARLLELTSGDKKESVVWWSLYVSPEGDTLYLSGQGPEGAVDYFKTEIAWERGEWHLGSLSYDKQETLLHLDNVLVAAGEALPEVPVAVTEATGLVVGTDGRGEDAVGGQFEELTTFDYPLPAWQFGPYYQAMREAASKGPISAAEETALVQAMADWSARRQSGLLTAEATGGGGFLLDSEQGFWMLTPQIDGTNVILSLWGAETNKSYDILFSRVLPASPWNTATNGTLGQFNFTLPLTNSIGFYRAVLGEDWDGDGVENELDAQPSNPAVSNLVITIEYPAPGAILD